MTQYIVLDRIEPGWTPPYCCHGRATCVGCGEWVWLGDQSYELVLSRLASPACRQCVEQHATPETTVIGNAGDHLRADGPH